MSQIPFSKLQLQAELQDNLISLNYEMMTPIQAQSLPHILAGKDVIAQAKTGSGKTAAFGLGLLEKVDVQKLYVQALVLCPTRELADQVAKELRRLARTIANVKVLSLCGGVSIRSQLSSLQYGAHIIVGTPGRIEDHLNRQSLQLNQVNILVLDEADRMLEMGFQAAVDAIVGKIPKSRQSLLFSATFPQKIKAVAKSIMNKPVMIEVEEKHNDSTIEQHFYHAPKPSERLQAVHLLLMQYRPESSVIFCNTKRETEVLASALIYEGFSALALNGDLEQRDRDQVMVRFANKSVSILVATDVAARGLDIDALDMVLNYEMAHDPEIYVHRIGRTGRAGKKGIACCLCHEKDDYKMTMLGDYIGRDIKLEALPDLSLLNEASFKSEMTTLQIGGGKKQKIRPGDILGALTAGKKIAGNDVGKIHIVDQWAYVAVHRNVVKTALQLLSTLKGRSFRVRMI